MRKLFLLTFLMSGLFAFSQDGIKVSAGEGIIVAGYVKDGGFLNFVGPNIKYVKKPMSIGLGMLPSLRFREDEVASGAIKNSPITPTLGAGVTFTYKHLVLQVPFYYTPKGGTKDGKWDPGFGIGYKF
jgi:hypothetical protein